MKKICSNLLRVTICLFVTFNFQTTHAEGSKQLMPDINSRVALCTNGLSAFAGYASAAIDRLNIHINDASTEVVYLNFSLGYGTGISNILGEGDGANFYFRIKDPAGNIVYGPQLINTNPIPSGTTGYNQILAGPSAITPGGYTAYTFTPASGNGDYYIEFNKTDPVNVTGSQCSFDYWDITVANASGAINGRIWSYAWGFYSKDYTTGGYSGVFKGKLFSYSTDHIVQSIDFANSGFKGGSYRIGLSSKGPGLSGNYVSDRQSIYNMRTVGKEFKIFLNDPDINVYPSGNIITNNLSFNTNPILCNATNITFNFSLVQGGIVEILLDFNGNNVFDPGTRDRVLAQTLSSGSNSIVWDLKDGLGVTVDPSTEGPVKVLTTYGKSVSHLTVADVEYFSGGFVPVVVRPLPPVPYTPKLFYDDTSMRNNQAVTAYPNRQYPDTTIPFNNASQPPAVELNGCTAPCHAWNNFGTQADNDIQNNSINGYGNGNSINTWWYSFVEQNSFIINLSTCAPVPVKMSLWAVVAKDHSAELNWVTESESNHRYFEIERSFDLNNFETIAVILNGIDIGSGKKSYLYTDLDTALKGKNIVYYRLKQVDIDGRINLSSVKTAKFNSPIDNEKIVQISPNPFTQKINVKFRTGRSGKAEITINNNNGQVVLSKQYSTNQGNNNILIEGLDKLSQGTYFLQLRINGSLIENQKIMKQ